MTGNLMFHRYNSLNRTRKVAIATGLFISVGVSAIALSTAHDYWTQLANTDEVSDTPKELSQSLVKDHVSDQIQQYKESNTGRLPPPESLPYYEYGMSSYGADTEVEVACVVDTSVTGLTCFDVVESTVIYSEQPPGDSESTSAGSTASVVSTTSGDVIGDNVEVVLDDPLLPVKSPFVDNKAVAQREYKCKTTPWLTLKAKRAAGC